MTPTVSRHVRARVRFLLGEADTPASAYVLITVDDLRGEVMRRINTARALERFVSLDHLPDEQEFVLFLDAATPPDELLRVLTALRGGSQGGDQGFPDAEIALTPVDATSGSVRAPGYVQMDRSAYHNVVRIPYGARLQAIRDQLKRLSPVQLGRAGASSSANPSPTGRVS